jgi:hypothetical protein
MHDVIVNVTTLFLCVVIMYRTLWTLVAKALYGSMDLENQNLSFKFYEVCAICVLVEKLVLSSLYCGSHWFGEQVTTYDIHIVIQILKVALIPRACD